MNTIVLTAKQARKIKKALKALEEVRLEVESDPENKVDQDFGISWYLEDRSSLLLMNGASHGRDGKQSANMDNIIEEFRLVKSSGGGF